MGFNWNFKTVITVRVLLLVATCLLLAELFNKDYPIIALILAIGLLTYQVFALIKYLDKSNRELASFLESIKYDDFTHTYYTKKTGTSMDELYMQFNNVIKKFCEIRAEKEAQYQYLRTIVQHVGIGILTFNKNGEIQIINAAAKSLLGIDLIKNVDDLSDVSTELVASLKELKTGGRDLMKIEKEGEEVQLAIYAIELVRREEEFKLISVQNIKSELEEKEMDAWQNLIRVLTHEIMNSVTPISSLAATVETNIEPIIDENFDVNKVTRDDLEDFHMAVKTIHKRSESLIKFVGDFRNLTRIPMPNKKEMYVNELIEPILTLIQHDIDSCHVNIKKEIPSNLKISADPEQIEQVLINLIKNGIQALTENDELQKTKEVTIKAIKDEKENVFIKIRDNGTGIDEDAVKKIFIPFFTTKKSGSGIGLSLSRQIMRRHGGNITVVTEVNAGTEFTLRFNA